MRRSSAGTRRVASDVVSGQVEKVSGQTQRDGLVVGFAALRVDRLRIRPNYEFAPTPKSPHPDLVDPKGGEANDEAAGR